jgi:hypothetical protein
VRSLPGLLVLLASAVPACLLYTDPINQAPQVAIVPPAMIYPGTLTFTAQASDPDGDIPILLWSTVKKSCSDARADWPTAKTTTTDSFDVQVTGHDPFCVRVIAQDRYGAQTPGKDYQGTPRNRSPQVVLTTDPPLPAGTSLPLYSNVRLVAGPPMDQDGDPVSFTWKGVDARGGALMLMACDPTRPEVRCFTADTSGTYSVTVEGTDGVPGSAPDPQTLKLPVLEDGPPCIETSDPSSDTDLIVLAATDPPRHFEVRQVRDDGNPFPPSVHGGTTFQWSTARDVPGTPPAWQRALGYDRASFDVGAGLFDDARPGSTYLVRVEVRDPAHQSSAELRALEVACEERPVCKLPDTCVRWLTWSVRFR